MRRVRKSLTERGNRKKEKKESLFDIVEGKKEGRGKCRRVNYNVCYLIRILD